MVRLIPLLLLLAFSCEVTSKSFLGDIIRVPSHRQGKPGGRVQLQQDTSNPSTANCTWKYYQQQLDHFSPGLTANHGATYMQRYCIYDKYWSKTSAGVSGPILFYTGNESPVEEYVNNTGLMWNVGKEVGALLVFAEHRYEGKSYPQITGARNCLGYCTSAQALADYATLITHLKLTLNADNSPVIAFGGSYGGMLAAWFRIKYPNIVVGSIAASAPIWGFALEQIKNFPRLNDAAVAISRGASKAGGATDMCRDNILASWPLIWQLGDSATGRQLISEAFDLCEPLNNTMDVHAFIQYAQSCWFEMGEGDYPFPSTYITYAVGPGLYPLPAWPMRKACDGGLNNDHGVKITGNTSDVDFSVSIGNLHIQVDWRKVVSNNYTDEDILANDNLRQLLVSLKNAIGVWYNVTGHLPCYGNGLKQHTTSSSGDEHNHHHDDIASAEKDVCTGTYTEGCWGPINCNENLHLVNTDVHGVGGDFYWPPNVQHRNFTIEDVIGPRGRIGIGCKYYETQGLYGVPSYSDPWTQWLTDYYGGLNIKSASNIVFSNGLLDPWSSGGVLTSLSPTLQSVILEEGAHHLDLFFPTKNDPPCAVKARQVETATIKQWIKEHYASLEV